MCLFLPWAQKPSRFEFALLLDGEIFGLCIGCPSRGRRHLSLYYMEGVPDDSHPFRQKIMVLILEGAIMYAKELGCTYLRLIKPVEGMRKRYENHGFMYYSTNLNNFYCEKLIRS